LRDDVRAQLRQWAAECDDEAEAIESLHLRVKAAAD
jgi:hypothetical protein